MNPNTEPTLQDPHGSSVPLGSAAGDRTGHQARLLAKLLCFLSCLLLLGALAGTVRAEIALPSVEQVLKDDGSKPHEAGADDPEGREPPPAMAVLPCSDGLHAIQPGAVHAPNFAILHRPARGPPSL